MMIPHALVLCCGSLVLSVACDRPDRATPLAEDSAPLRASSPSAPEPAAPPVAERAERFVETMDRVATIHRTKADDCTALRRELDAFRAGHAAELDPADDVYRAIDADQALERRMHASMETVMTVSMKCEESRPAPAPSAIPQGKPVPAPSR